MTTSVLRRPREKASCFPSWDQAKANMSSLDFIDRADVWVIQSGGGLRFALEAGEGLRIASDFRQEEFESHEAVELGVFRFVDHAQPSPAQFFEHVIAGNVLDGSTSPWVGL